MKLTQIIAPLATLSMALAHGDEPKSPYSSQISFKKEGISNLVNVAVESPKGSGSDVIKGVMEFFKRNPSVLKSIMTEAKKSEHSEAKNKAISLAMELYSKPDDIDLHQTGLDVIKYTYENPKFLNLVQKAGIQAMKDNPTLVDDFFAEAEKAVAEDPSILTRVKDYVIEFSHDNEEAYKQGYELALKSAMINPGFSSHLLVHILQVDRIGCKGASKGTCDCKDSSQTSEGNTVKPEETESIDEIPEVEAPEADFDEEIPENTTQDESPEDEYKVETPETDVMDATPVINEQESVESEEIQDDVAETPEPVEEDIKVDEPVNEEPAAVEKEQEPLVSKPVYSSEGSNSSGSGPNKPTSDKPAYSVNKAPVNNPILVPEVEFEQPIIEEPVPEQPEPEAYKPEQFEPEQTEPEQSTPEIEAPVPEQIEPKKPVPEVIVETPSKPTTDKYEVALPPANKPSY